MLLHCRRSGSNGESKLGLQLPTTHWLPRFQWDRPCAQEQSLANDCTRSSAPVHSDDQPATKRASMHRTESSRRQSAPECPERSIWFAKLNSAIGHNQPMPSLRAASPAPESWGLSVRPLYPLSLCASLHAALRGPRRTREIDSAREGRRAQLEEVTVVKVCSVRQVADPALTTSLARRSSLALTDRPFSSDAPVIEAAATRETRSARTTRGPCRPCRRTAPRRHACL